MCYGSRPLTSKAAVECNMDNVDTILEINYPFMMLMKYDKILGRVSDEALTGQNKVTLEAQRYKNSI